MSGYILHKNKNPAAAEILRGDDTGAARHYVWQSPSGAIHASAQMQDILAAMADAGVQPQTNKDAISHLLHHSLIPTPWTIYEDVYALGIGDRLEYSGSSKPHYTNEFPYFQEEATERSRPSTQKLLSLLCASVRKNCPDNGVLMMSSGKDSTALALAVKEAGLEQNIRAFTYVDPASDYEDEAEFAGTICEKLGLAHEVITVPHDAAMVKNAMLYFFEHSPMPSCDPTTIPYFIGLHHAGIQNTTILDGTRNDVYMGILPTPTYKALGLYYRALGGGWPGFHQARNVIPFYHKANKFFTSLPAVSLYKHGHFRAQETKKFFPQARDKEEFWLDLYKDLRRRNAQDIRNFVIGQYFDGCGVVVKAESVAAALDCKVALPWADPDIAAYFFNLPADYKYNAQTGTNKILLREMLREKLDYDAKAIGKRIFYFNLQKFIIENKEFIADEIMNCALWDKNIQNLWPVWMVMFERHPRVGGAIMDLFMISGWYNHSCYRKGMHHG